MNMSVSSRPLSPDLNSKPTDFSSLSGKHPQQSSLNGASSGNGSGNQSIDPSQLLFARPAQSQVNFAPQGSQDQQSPVSSAGGLEGNNASSMVQQIMTLLMQLMQMLSQSKDPASEQSKLATQNSGGGGGGGAGGVEGGGAGGGDSVGGSGEGEGSEDGASGVGNTSNAASSVSPETSLTGSGDLHLPKELEPYRADIMDASKATGVPPSVLAGQIWAESRGKLDAATTNVNGKSDAGLMQVNADTFAGLKKENPGLLGKADVNNAHDNIMAGALYMRDQHKAFGDWGGALRAYNSGPDKVNKSNLSDTGGVGGSSYPDDVLKFAKIIESGQGQLPA